MPTVALGLAQLWFLGPLGLLAHGHRIRETIPFGMQTLCQPISTGRRRAVGEQVAGEHAHATVNPIQCRQRRMAH
jgi:hypothetical protein